MNDIQLTIAQKKVLKRLLSLGSCAWLGDGVNRESGKTIDTIASQVNRIKKVYGKKESQRYANLVKKAGLTNNGVWCSVSTLTKLQNMSLIEPINEIAGAWKLTNLGWSTVE